MSPTQPHAESGLSAPAVDEALAIAVERGEIAVQAAAYHGGRMTVDAWTGPMLPDGAPIDGDTLFPILSATKAVVAVAVQMQVDRGQIDLDAPVASYWPEFAQGGKDRITVAQVLAHQAGLAHLPPKSTTETLLDWDNLVEALARLEPWFEGGSRNAYHALTWGHLLGEVVRRTDPSSRAFGQWVQEEICRPLGITGLWIGLPPEADAITSDVTAENWPAADPARMPLRAAALPPAMIGPHVFQNRTDFRRACVPAGNGIANARSLARLFAMLACGGALDGVRLLSEERVRACLIPRPHTDEPDSIFGGGISRFGSGGFTIGRVPPGERPDVVYGAGAILSSTGGGGTYAWADLDTGFAGAICHNRLMNPIPAEPELHPFVPLADAMRGAAQDI